MTTLNISLPNTLKEFINSQVKNFGYSTVSEYIRELVRKAQKESEEVYLEKLIKKSIESGKPTEMTKKDWDKLYSRIEKKK